MYAHVASRIGIAPMFDFAPGAQSAPSPGGLVYPTVLEDSILYGMVSDAAQDAGITPAYTPGRPFPDVTTCHTITILC